MLLQIVGTFIFLFILVVLILLIKNRSKVLKEKIESRSDFAVLSVDNGSFFEKRHLYILEDNEDNPIVKYHGSIQEYYLSEGEHELLLRLEERAPLFSFKKTEAYKHKSIRLYVHAKEEYEMYVDKTNFKIKIVKLKHSES